jgi:redox-sensitive bicupin YhaK (pirin superfamily)
MPACVESVILPPAHDIGGFEVRRAFPATQRQIFGPFIFFDQMGPGEFLTGKGLDVRLHPISSVCPRHLLVRWRDPASRQPRL